MLYDDCDMCLQRFVGEDAIRSYLRNCATPNGILRICIGCFRRRDMNKEINYGTPCEDCGGDGYLFPHGEPSDQFITVERCDSCKVHLHDGEAASALAGKLLALNEGWAITDLVLPGWKWDDGGACHYVVMKETTDQYGAVRYRPITEAEAIELDKRLHPKPEPTQ